MNPIAFTLVEGGEWIPWADRKKIDEACKVGGLRVHAIKFDTGLIFDALNGWRAMKATY